MRQNISLLLLATILFYSCKKTDNILPNTNTSTTITVITITKPDTAFAFTSDTLIKTWKDTIQKIVKDPNYKTKHDTIFLTKQDSVVLIKHIPPQASKIELFFLGTSITFGTSSADGVSVPVPADKTYPAQVNSFFAGSKSYGGWFNFGVPGAIVDNITSIEIPEVAAKIDLVNYTKPVALIEAGINDCAQGYSAPDIYNAIKNVHYFLHEKGVYTIAITPTPFNNNLHAYNHDAAAAEVTRQKLIALLKNGWQTDLSAIALINLADDKFVGKFTGNSGFDLNVFQPDGIHFTPLGYGIIANYAEKTIFCLK